MVEQTSTAKELTTGVDGIRVQSEQAARAASEQARTMKEMAKAAELSAREIRSVAKANQQHSKSAAKVAAQLADIRRITQRNADGVSRTRGGTADLIEQARTLVGSDERLVQAIGQRAQRPVATRMNTAPTLGVVTTDRHLAIRGWNEWVAAATGVAEDDAIGRPLLSFVAAERADFYRDLLSRGDRHRLGTRARAGLSQVPDRSAAAVALGTLRAHAAARHNRAAVGRRRRWSA